MVDDNSNFGDCTTPRLGVGARYAPLGRTHDAFDTMAAMPAGTALDTGCQDVGNRLDPDACSQLGAATAEHIRSCPASYADRVSTWPSSFGRAPHFPAALRHAPRLGPAASSRTRSLFRRQLTRASCAAERTGLAGRRVTLHRTRFRTFDRSSPGRGSCSYRSTQSLYSFWRLPPASTVKHSMCSLLLRDEIECCRISRA